MVLAVGVFFAGACLIACFISGEDEYNVTTGDLVTGVLGLALMVLGTGGILLEMVS